MADPAEAQVPPEENLGPCGWCEQQAVTRLYTQGKPGAKHRKTAPVCGDHERHFINQGATSVRSELTERHAKNAKQYIRPS